MDTELKEYVIDLADKAQIESKYYPVDREFLESHLNKILSFDYIDFLFYNFELNNDTYVNQLLFCLPELWSNITLDDLIRISEKFSNILSFFTLLKFTYKIIEIDIIEPILDIPIVKKSSYHEGIMQYLEKQYNVLIKSEGDLEDIEDKILGIDYSEWKYIKQVLLTDSRVKPSLTSVNDMMLYVETLKRTKL